MNPEYRPGFPWRNAHLNTIWANRVRRVAVPTYQRVRIDTPDGDFLDLDTRFLGNPTIAIVLHGLEGSSQSFYMRSIVQSLGASGLDVVAMNHRGCSGETNRLYPSYHSGKTQDLQAVLDYLTSKRPEAQFVIVGFSLGGNVALKWAGDQEANVPASVKAVAAVSVPVDLEGCARVLERGFNRVYLKNFLVTLKQKLREKAGRFPEQGLLSKEIDQVKNFFEFDDLYTAPANGFGTARNYYRQCSSLFVLDQIRVPTLLINAADDPFLSPACYPKDVPARNSHFQLRTPRFGGHVGFMGSKVNGRAWHEEQVIRFFEDLVQ